MLYAVSLMPGSLHLQVKVFFLFVVAMEHQLMLGSDIFIRFWCVSGRAVTNRFHFFITVDSSNIMGTII